MKEQSFKNHAQYVFGFHVITLLIMLMAVVMSVIMIASNGITPASALSICIVATLAFLYYYTRSFANGNQDRIIRAEENFRCYLLTGKPLDKNLKIHQIIALRFAGDEEFADLMAIAVRENLGAKEIKNAIKNWKADYQRI